MTHNCVVTGGSSNDAAPIGVLLLNLKDTQDWINHVVIYHDGISARDQALMQKIIPVEFVFYKFPGNASKFNEIVKYYFTEMVFCKYECFKLLERFENVLWTDYDVVFLKNVPELLEPGISGLKTLMYDKNSAVGTLRRQLRHGKEALVGKKYDLDTLSMATGLFVLNRKLPVKPHELYNACIQLTEEYSDCLCLPEQAIFDMLFQDFHFSPEPISWTYAMNPKHPKDQLLEAKILHAAAQPKFWNGLHNDTWNANYQQWLQMGGSPWKVGWAGFVKKIKRSLAYRWNKLLRK